MSKKTLIAAGLFSIILVVGLSFFLWRGASTDVALKTGPAEVEIQTLAVETLNMADVLSKYRAGEIDSNVTADSVIKSNDNIYQTLRGLESKELQPIELETSVATYMAFNDLFSYYEEDFIKIDRELENNADVTNSSVKTLRLLYNFVQESVQNLQVPKYKVSDTTDDFIKRIEDRAENDASAQ